MGYSKLNLKKNPFVNIADSESRAHLIWAGIPILKQQLEDIHRQALITNSRQIVLNWGTIGVGKTYAANYFNHEPRLEALAPEYDGNIFCVHVRMRKEAHNAAVQLFKDILDSLSLSRIKLQVQSLIQDIGKNELQNLLTRRIRSEEFAKAIVLIGNKDTEIAELMPRYLYGSATNTELKKMGLARPLKSTADFAKVLAGILLCFVGIQGHQPGRIFLWLDEMEDLLFFTTRQYRPFSQFLRDVFDQLNEGCTVFMNFTLAEPDQDTIKLLLGEALWSRINKKIRFNALTTEEATAYCKDLLKLYQIKNLGEYSPFTAGSLDAVIKSIPQANRSPGEINKYCNEVLNFALTLGKTHISEEVIFKWGWPKIINYDASPILPQT